MAASGIRAKAAAPGPIPTDMLDRITGFEAGKPALLATAPPGRAGTPEVIADAIACVASGKASFTTGEVLRANGGMRGDMGFARRRHALAAWLAGLTATRPATGFILMRAAQSRPNRKPCCSTYAVNACGAPCGTAIPTYPSGRSR
ncbi:hypothetical protein Bpla01_38610 [Burkholderia plantarii]|nr:hypothetical protein Bpla01_38610 [Burkholderia plantarii]